MRNLAHDSPTGLSPRRLIFEMLDADPTLMANGRRLVAAGNVFSFSENQMRVALSRLLADGLLVQPKRGEYAFSGAATAIQQEVQHWQKIEQRLRRWRGDWCGVLTENLAAEGSTRFRSQTRALALRGLQRWRPGLWVRPNNLRGGLQRLGEELLVLGLDAMKGQCLITRGDSECEAGLRALWNSDELEKKYRQRLKQLLAAGKRLENPRFPQVLIETMELGSDTIRALLKDPLLPDEMASGDSRRQLIRLLQQYDQLGRRQWQLFIQQL
jgi:phenylacetic acid degradation operon negative regulatory protein